MYWVAACIRVHNYTLQHEAGECCAANPEWDKDNHHDSFINEGLSDSNTEHQELPDSGEEAATSHQQREPKQLQLAKKKHEELKEKLFLIVFVTTAAA